MSNTNFTFDKDVLSKSNQSDCVDTNGIVRNGLVYMIYRNKDDNPVKIIGFPAEWVRFIKGEEGHGRDEWRYLLVCNDKPYVALTDRMIVQANQNLEDFGVPVDLLRIGHRTISEYQKILSDNNINIDN